MLLEIRMFDEFYEIEIIRCTREVSRIPELNENIIVLKDGYKNCGVITKVLNSYADKDFTLSGKDEEYYTVECILKDRYKWKQAS